jgi:membrane protease YdiL (CAAX protease family)
MSNAVPVVGGERKSWRESKWLIVVELLVVSGTFVLDAHHYIPLSKTIFLFAFAWVSLRVRGRSWRTLGLRKYGTWVQTIGWGAALGALLEAFELFVSQPVLVRLLHKQPDLDIFQALHGNLKWTLLAILGAWTLAAFGEEMVYRGYLMNRVADFFNRTNWAWVLSLFAVHIGFGLAHAYQGITGMIDEALMGFLLGVIYLRTGRNLAVPIVAHGLTDTIDFVLMFVGKYPGM